MDTKIAELLEDVKKLLILDLVAKGVQSTNIAHTLGVDNAVITRIAPARKIKKGIAKS
jgi:hypothetical protein